MRNSFLASKRDASRPIPLEPPVTTATGDLSCVNLDNYYYSRQRIINHFHLFLICRFEIPILSIISRYTGMFKVVRQMKQELAGISSKDVHRAVIFQGGGAIGAYAAGVYAVLFR